MKLKQVHRKKIKRPNKPPRKQDDKLIKSAMEEFFIWFLRFMYPDADDIFDFSRGITFLNKSLPFITPNRKRRKGDREADLIAKVYLKDGTERWIVLHAEIEATTETNFAYRVLLYHIRLIDHYEVPITTIVVYTGKENQPRPSSLYLESLDTSIHFKFRSYHIFDHTEEELLAMDNPFALITLAAQKAALYDYLTDIELNDTRVAIIRALRASGKYSVEQIEHFVHFLTNLIFIDNPDLNRIFDSTIKETTGGKITMGIIETVKAINKEEGKIEGKTEEVKNLIVKLGFSNEQAADIAEVSADFVREVRSSIAKQHKK